MTELHDLLGEAMTEYVDHQSWRCEHGPHFYFADPAVAQELVVNGDCPCGLLGFQKRVQVALTDGAAPLHPEAS